MGFDIKITCYIHRVVRSGTSFSGKFSRKNSKISLKSRRKVTTITYPPDISSALITKDMLGNPEFVKINFMMLKMKKRRHFCRWGNV